MRIGLFAMLGMLGRFTDRRMRLRCQAAALACLAAAAPGADLQGQAAERFGGRLSRLPVDLATAHAVRGAGEVRAVLDGDVLEIVATFEGMSSPATAAHVHRAPRARRGPVALAVDVPPAAAGRIETTVRLAPEQAAALRDGLYYLQIHTEANAGGELRGWLLPR